MIEGNDRNGASLRLAAEIFEKGCRLESDGHHGEAERAYREAIGLQALFPEAHFNLANLLRTKGRFDDAVRSYTRAIESRAEFLEAHVNLGNLLKSLGRPREAEGCYRRAIHLRPRDHHLPYSLGSLLEAQDRKPEALEQYRQSFELKPDFHHGVLATARILAEQGRTGDAVDLLETALESNPSQAEIYIMLANIHQTEGNLDQAVQVIQECITRCPTSVEAINNLGTSFEEQGDLDRAMDQYRRAISLNPDFYQAHYNLGRVSRLTGNLDQALRSLSQAIHLNPLHFNSLNELGITLERKGRPEEACSLYMRAIEIDDTSYLPFHNLGNLALGRRDSERAIAMFQEALRRCPSAGTTMLELAMAHLSNEDIDEALACYQKAAAIDPELADGQYAVYGLAFHIKSGDWRSADQTLRTLMNHDFTVAETDSLAKLLYHLGATDLDPQHIKAKYEEFGLLMEQRTPTSPFEIKQSDYQSRKLRIGYISPDFREHTMGRFTRAILEHHDLKRFEVFCYSLSSLCDSITKDIEGFAHCFRRISDYTNFQRAQAIYDDRIHILIDLAGHTAGNAIEVLAMKPAPVIVTHIGHPNGTGLRAVDYKLTDYHADRDDAAKDYVETLVRIPGSIYPYVKSVPDPIPFDKRAAGIDPSLTALGAFCAIHKLNPTLMRVWKRILDGLGNTALVLSPRKAYRKYCLQLATSCGITPDRVFFLDIERGSSRYQALDVALDTFPYGGGITSINALNMLVPIVTLKGRKHGERMTYSILKALGVTSTITDNTDEYVATAIRLARDLPFRTFVRDQIHQALGDSPLVDMASHVRHLESAYEEMWRRTMAGEKPREIRI